MSADELRKAAETLRHRAKQSTAGPWVQHPAARQLLVTADGQGIVARQCAVANGPYIATMHPGVGLALADLLGETAESWDLYGAPEHVADEYSEFVHLARLINGGAS